MVLFQEMTHEAFLDFREIGIKNYAEQSVKAGRVLEAASLKWSIKEFDRLLPEDEKTNGHFFYHVLEKKTEEFIGSIWFYGKTDKGGRMFLYDIIIEPEKRGKGYGKATMLALEELGKKMGFNEIDLHVYSWNETAFNLYKSIGFETKSYMMRKHF